MNEGRLKSLNLQDDRVTRQLKRHEERFSKGGRSRVDEDRS